MDQEINKDEVVETTEVKEVKLNAEELLKDLKDTRAESKARRLALKERDNLLKELIGLDPDAEVSDWKKHIDEFKNSLTKKEQEILTKVNNRLIESELKTKGEDYDLKLLNKLLDKSKITVEDETIKGLQEQLEELEKEYPAIKKVKNTGSSVNPANANNIKETKLQELRKQMGL
jgi:ribosomal protein L29